MTTPTPVSITGADPADTGPGGCVARFVGAGARRDAEAAMAELHPDHREGASADVGAAPGITAVAILPAEEAPDGMLVPTVLTGEDGGEQRFTFLVRPAGDGWGIDLQGSLVATFGGDPMQMIEDGLRAAVQPLGDAMQAMGEGLSRAFGGDEGAAPERLPRRIFADEELAVGGLTAPDLLPAAATELQCTRRVVRDDDGVLQRSGDLTVRLAFALPAEWTVQRTLGVAIEAATGCDGEDLAPEDAPEDLGSERYAEWERERRDFYAKVPLRAPEPSCRGLAELRGRVRMEVTGGEQVELLLGPVGGLLGRPVPIPACGVTVELGRDEEGALVLTAPSAWFERVEIRPVDAVGETLDDSWSGWGDGETTRRTWGSAIPDEAALRIRFWTLAGTVEMPFRVEGLPLTL